MLLAETVCLKSNLEFRWIMAALHFTNNLDIFSQRKDKLREATKQRSSLNGRAIKALPSPPPRDKWP